MPSMVQAETTLCTVVEGGYLEQQVLLLAESLRRFGGRRAETPLIAIRPRKGPRISRSIAKRFCQLNVFLVEDDSLNAAFDWWATMNKPAALRYVEQHAKTSNVTWIDGDMMVLKDLSRLAPPSGFDFISRAGESCDVASNGMDGKDEFWRRLSSKVGLDFDAFPEILSFPERKPIKAYWQAGLFTYSKRLRFSEVFYQVKAKMLEGDVASKAAGTYHTDQVALALAVQVQSLRAAEYDPKMNFNVSRLNPTGLARMSISDVEIMQYHSSLFPNEYVWTMNYLEALPLNRRTMIARHAPFGERNAFARLERKLLELGRKRKIKKYQSRVIQY